MKDYDSIGPLKFSPKCDDFKGVNKMEAMHAAMSIYNKLANILNGGGINTFNTLWDVKDKILRQKFDVENYDKCYGYCMMKLAKLISYAKNVRVNGHRIFLADGIDCILMDLDEMTGTIAFTVK